ncbi:tRNA uridine-5-carboxymethylaminomethyl(34) synthesis GTPase MnmE [bacterium]|nr:tRNA uridine-5-carboxymethylaminomethyl(34) synthesis GTPase MnmE [bacterium]
MQELDDTITAIATPTGVGGIAIIRISGIAALSIAKQLCPTLKKWDPRYVSNTSFRHPETKTLIDEGCIVFFQSPLSFTGEDVVECHCHGSPVVQKQLLSAILTAGGRLATAGEFTKRAFLNGKMDLTKAESIADLIHAETDISKTVALSHLQGKLYNHINHIRSQLMDTLEHIEASIDFPDEVDPLEVGILTKTLTSRQQQVQSILDLKDYGKWIHTGVKCLIVGTPNVGKSSILNQLIGENRAIVTNIAGTTRDFIESRVEIGGILFEFTDTAGLRDTLDLVEKEGVSRVQSLMEKAHVILWVIDGTRALSKDEEKLYTKLKKHPHCYGLQNKSDLMSENQVSSLKNVIAPLISLSISAKTGAGFSDLKQRLVNDFSVAPIQKDADLICNVRQVQCLEKALSSIDAALRGLSDGHVHDVLSIDIKTSIQALGELTGDELTEEVLDGIFSRFCIGK